RKTARESAPLPCAGLKPGVERHLPGRHPGTDPDQSGGRSSCGGFLVVLQGVEIGVHALQLLFWVREGIEALAEQIRVAELAGIPTYVLASEQRTAKLAIQLMQLPDVSQQSGSYFGQGACRQQHAGVQVMGDLLEYPRVTLGGTTDHDAIGARVSEHLLGLLGTVDVAIGNHR